MSLFHSNRRRLLPPTKASTQKATATATTTRNRSRPWLFRSRNTPNRAAPVATARQSAKAKRQHDKATVAAGEGGGGERNGRAENPVTSSTTTSMFHSPIRVLGPSDRSARGRHTSAWWLPSVTWPHLCRQKLKSQQVADRRRHHRRRRRCRRQPVVGSGSGRPSLFNKRPARRQPEGRDLPHDEENGKSTSASLRDPPTAQHLQVQHDPE